MDDTGERSGSDSSPESTHKLANATTGVALAWLGTAVASAVFVGGLLRLTVELASAAVAQTAPLPPGISPLAVVLVAAVAVLMTVGMFALARPLFREIGEIMREDRVASGLRPVRWMRPTRRVLALLVSALGAAVAIAIALPGVTAAVVCVGVGAILRLAVTTAIALVAARG